jgi:hypothetical protein
MLAAVVVVAQETPAQTAPQGTGAPAENGAAPRGAQPVVPADQRPAPPSGCPYRNQKLELIA